MAGVGVGVGKEASEVAEVEKAGEAGAAGVRGAWEVEAVVEEVGVVTEEEVAWGVVKVVWVVEGVREDGEGVVGAGAVVGEGGWGLEVKAGDWGKGVGWGALGVGASPGVFGRS